MCFIVNSSSKDASSSSEILVPRRVIQGSSMSNTKSYVFWPDHLKFSLDSNLKKPEILIGQRRRLEVTDAAVSTMSNVRDKRSTRNSTKREVEAGSSYIIVSKVSVDVSLTLFLNTLEGSLL